MGLLGDFAKGFVILAGVFSAFAIIGFVLMNHFGIALLFLLTLLIPIILIALDYFEEKKNKKNQSGEWG